jgi:hypothetical protein
MAQMQMWKVSHRPEAANTRCVVIRPKRHSTEFRWRSGCGFILCGECRREEMELKLRYEKEKTTWSWLAHPLIMRNCPSCMELLCADDLHGTSVPSTTSIAAANNAPVKRRIPPPWTASASYQVGQAVEPLTQLYWESYDVGARDANGNAPDGTTGPVRVF